ncbi:MAG: hypothetical protein H0Z38_08320 [Firmicutes bacterium]|nr:hypothetical protein [Bacillota bacterium]
MSLGPASLAALVLVGLVIKVCDDYLDGADEEVFQGSGPVGGYVIHASSRGILAYALLVVLVAAYLDFEIAASFFLSAYTVGMVGLNQVNRLPSGLYPMVESAFVVGFGFLATGGLYLPALACTVAIQALDDLVDRESDRLNGTRSWCKSWGVIPTLLVFGIAASLALYLNWSLTVTALGLSRLLTWVLDRQIRWGRELK